ncbi:MAG: hypothetical protein GQE15_11710 [Archangiaceae bacterium]|nr:hypothetical protein [Archangiaceae bacterium]
MSDETAWSHLLQTFREGKRFEAALPGLQAFELNGEDIGVLLNNPSTELFAWMMEGAGDTPVRLSAVEPPPDAPLPPRRMGARGLLGWLRGATAIEGLGLFTTSDVFELHGVQFAVLPEPLRPVAFGELVEVRVLALNCTSVPHFLTVGITAQKGVVQSPRRYELALDPGVISMAVLPIRVCPSSPGVVRLDPVFDVDEVTAMRLLQFAARPYAKPVQELLSVVAGVTVVAAVAGLSPVYLASNGSGGRPDPIRLRPDLVRPLLAAAPRAPALLRLANLR